MIKKCFIVVMYITALCGITMVAPGGFPQEDNSEFPPKELVEELLADKDLPDEVRKELEDMLKEEGINEPGKLPQAEYTPKGMMSPGKGSFQEIREAPKRPYIPKKAEAPAKAKSEEAEQPAISEAGPNRISLDLKGVDIIDVLKMLSARSSLNIVAGRNVRGRVTLFLKDVDLWDAFEIILAANGLAYEKQGDIINVMTERDYEQLYGEKYYDKKELRIYRLEYAKASDVSKSLNQAKSKIGKIVVDEGSNTLILVDSPKSIYKMENIIREVDMPIETKIFSLDYAKAEDIKAKITDILTKGIGTLQVDERTNKLVITDLMDKMPEITDVITSLDEKHKEVLIEAKIVEISLNNDYKYGIDWKAIFRSLADEGIKINFDNVTGNSTIFSGTGTGGALTITSFASKYFDLALEALQTEGKTNVISSPRITVLNNEEAKVLVGTNQPYISDSTTVTSVGDPVTSETITYVDVGVELTVTPTINKKGFITMKIKPKISSVTGQLGTEGDRQSIPIVSTSETETTVMVKDGNTILIAGLIEDRDEEEENKIPFLGDIPIIGYLFKNKTVGSGSTSSPEKKELVVFLTPYIVQGTEIFPEAENTWYGNTITQRELLEKQMSFAVEDIKRRRSLVKETPVTQETVSSVEEEAPVKEAVITPNNLTAPAVGGYYSYFENLRNRIFWIAKDTYPIGFSGVKNDVEVLFKLSNNGRLKGSPEILNDVDSKLAKAAENAVKKAAPFPPFPSDMDTKEETFKITIAYN